MAGKKGGAKKGYYERQKGVTAQNKRKLAAKRTKNLTKWINLGKKKNGDPVLSVGARKERAAIRKANRDNVKAAALAFRRAARDAVNRYGSKPRNRNRNDE